MVTVTLLTRAGCTLCEQARRRLTAITHGQDGVVVTEVDVDTAPDRELRAEFGDRLPVVLLDGVEHSYGEVDEQRLLRDLAT